MSITASTRDHPLSFRPWIVWAAWTTRQKTRELIRTQRTAQAKPCSTREAQKDKRQPGDIKQFCAFPFANTVKWRMSGHEKIMGFELIQNTSNSVSESVESGKNPLRDPFVAIGSGTFNSVWPAEPFCCPLERADKSLTPYQHRSMMGIWKQLPRNWMAGRSSEYGRVRNHVRHERSEQSSDFSLQ